MNFCKREIFIFCFSLLNFSFIIFNSAIASPVPLSANAGKNTGVCPGDSVKLGGNPSATGGTPPYTYSWQPAASLSNATSSNPYAYPSSPTNYTLTVTDGAGNKATSIVNVTTYISPVVSAGPDQTILSGATAQLLASGAVNYYWSPTQTLYNQNSASPTAEPQGSTKYCVIGVDGNGCMSSDCMEVYVIPSDVLVVYNAFSPNGDGTNDYFFVANILKYPKSKLEVFNRNGKLVYQSSPYKNDWNGKADGAELPSATYYYVLTPGDGKDKVHGSVTIIR